MLLYLPELQHVHQHGYVQHVDTTTNVDVPQHYQALAELQAGFLRQIRLPVRTQNLLQLDHVQFRGIFDHELS